MPSTYKRYQVTFDENGQIVSTIELPEEPTVSRTILVREETPNKARQVAQELYSLAE